MKSTLAGTKRKPRDLPSQHKENAQQQQQQQQPPESTTKRRRAAAVAADSRIQQSTRKSTRRNPIPVAAEADGEFMFTRVRNLPPPEPVLESPAAATKAAKTQKTTKTIKKKETKFFSFNDDEEEQPESSTTIVSLPLTDTPMIRRNKELRQQQGSRRSSLGMRGKRASSLSNGLVAVPHADIKTDEFFKHLDADLPDPHRMRQLLSWCGHRVLAEEKEADKKSSRANRARGGGAPATAITRVIEEEILKDLTDGRISTSWWSRPDEEDLPKKPNPQNVANLEKIDEFTKRLERLRAEKKAWTEVENDIKPPIPPSTNIDVSLLLPKEATFLARQEEAASTPAAEAKLDTLKDRASNVEIETDKLVHGMHSIEQLARAAGKYADRVRADAAGVVERKERQAQKVAGTEDLEMRDVLRSLSKVDRL
ncbi:mis12-mtw1 family protein [Myxozyma melibiosi]|uniref:Mis12-mtw1 family protein n=1 Tax=Myxozyma melibiosi TaxID=54550 RepID=A0ABR1EYY2_9ASCO